MRAMLGGVTLAAVMIVGTAGAAAAREGAADHGRGFKGKGFAMPRYESGTRVTGPEQPYSWPVADRYRPVSKPFYGRAY